MKTQTKPDKPYKLLSLVIPLLLLVNIVAPVMAQEMMTIEVVVRDENWQPLNDVILFVCKSVNGAPGPVHSVWFIDFSDYITLPKGEYFLVPAKADYVSSQPGGWYITEGATNAYLYMESSPGVGYPVHIKAIDKNGDLIPDVTFMIYRCLTVPPYTPVELIMTVYSDLGHIYLTGLSKGYYCVEVVKEGYSQRFPIEESRFANHDSFPTLNIIMDIDRGPPFLNLCIKSIANLFGVSFDVGKNILGMLLALAIGTATAKHLKGGAQEFGLGMLGGVVLGVLIGLLPVWVMVLLVLIVGLWIGKRYMDGGE